MNKKTKVFVMSAMCIFSSHTGFSDEAEAEDELYSIENKVNQLKSLSYKELLRETYKNDNADVLLLTMIAIDHGSLSADITSLDEIENIFGEANVEKINELTYFIKLQKGKSQNSYMEIEGGFIPKESNEWYLVIRLSEKNVVNTFSLFFGLGSRLEKVYQK